MQAYVDKDLCISCGLCPAIAGDVFEMDDTSGKAKVVVDQVPSASEDAAKEAEGSCPTNAIKVE